VRHVEADAFRIARFHVIGERRCRRDDVVGARLAEQVAARAEGGALDAVAAAIGEDVIADARHVAAPEIVPERIVVVLLDGDDPHVDAVVAHRARQDLLELVERIWRCISQRLLASCAYVGRTATGRSQA
jgi:hypothetical protein